MTLEEERKLMIELQKKYIKKNGVVVYDVKGNGLLYKGKKYNQLKGREEQWKI